MLGNYFLEFILNFRNHCSLILYLLKLGQGSRNITVLFEQRFLDRHFPLLFSIS